MNRAQNHSAQIKRERNNERTVHLVFVTKPRANINIFAERKVSIDSTAEGVLGGFIMFHYEKMISMTHNCFKINIKCV